MDSQLFFAGSQLIHSSQDHSEGSLEVSRIDKHSDYAMRAQHNLVQNVSTSLGISTRDCHISHMFFSHIALHSQDSNCHTPAAASEAMHCYVIYSSKR